MRSSRVAPRRAAKMVTVDVGVPISKNMLTGRSWKNRKWLLGGWFKIGQKHMSEVMAACVNATDLNSGTGMTRRRIRLSNGQSCLHVNP